MHSIETVTSEALRQVRDQLGEALAVAKAAEALAREGQSARALRIALDIEPLAVDVNHLLQGIAVLSRLSQRADDTTDL